jgi:hypothetical protein
MNVKKGIVGQGNASSAQFQPFVIFFHGPAIVSFDCAQMSQGSL